MQTLAGRDIADMLPRDERKSRVGCLEGGEGSGISCLSNIQLSHPGKQPSRGSCMGGRYSPRISWLLSDSTERGHRKAQLC
jgi:hypothetical protein